VIRRSGGRRNVRLSIGVAAGIALAALWLWAAWLLWRTSVPADLRLPELDLQDYFTPRELDRAEGFERFLRASWLVSTVAVVLALAAMAARGSRLAARVGIGRVGTGVVLGVVTVTVVWAVTLPSALAAEWWQRRHGLSLAPYGDVFLAAWVGLIAQGLFVALAVAVVMGLAGRLGRLWPLAAAPLSVGLGVALIVVSPYLFFEADPARTPTLLRDIRSLSHRTGVSGTPVRIDEVHEETTLANALALGLGPTEKVILWDTLLDGRFPRGEIRVVLAHEFGHIGRRHLWKGAAWTALVTLPLLLVVSELTRRRGGLARPAVIPLAALVLACLDLALAPAYNAVSRRYEAESDWVALQATRDAASARNLFRRFGRTSLGDPEPPTWSYLFSGTHPTLVQRIAMAEAWKAREGPKAP